MSKPFQGQFRNSVKPGSLYFGFNREYVNFFLPSLEEMRECACDCLLGIRSVGAIGRLCRDQLAGEVFMEWFGGFRMN